MSSDMYPKLIAFCLICVGLTADAKPFSVSGKDMSLSFDGGRCVSLKESVSGRELLREPSPWASYVAANGKDIRANDVSHSEDGSITITFVDGTRLVERVKETAFGLEFSVEDFTATDFKSLTLACLRPACRSYVGGTANAASDDDSAISLRAFDYESEMKASAESLRVCIDGRFPVRGKRFALIAGPRKGFVEKLRDAVKASGLVYSEAGGPWSLGSPQARQSYMFANIFSKAADAWVDAAVRAGISIVHLHSWHDTLGHYGVNQKKYPGGIEEMKAVADKIRAAGMNVSMHTLTACIDFRDSWVTPVAHSNLVATYTYTLAKPLTKDSTEIVVNEMPGPKHDVVMTYSSNGNAIEIDGELMTYTGIRREKPYAFTGITRGVYNTKVGDHAAGARAKYLQQRYFAFYPEVDSPLADELADRLAYVYNTIGADMIYLDGSEGMRDPYAISKMASKIVARLDKRIPPRVEMSCSPAHFWPFRSAVGALDNVTFGAKPFEAYHIRANDAAGRKSNFMETQMGWWQPQMPKKTSRGRFPDETEYFAAKNAGADSAMSLQGLNANNGFLPTLQEKALTTIGWYERFRLARAFSEDVMKDLANLDKEGVLEQDDKGEWTYTPIESRVHRVLGEGVGNRWKFDVPASGMADIRVEALSNLSNYESPAARSVFGAKSLAKFSPVSAKGVKLESSVIDDPERGRVTRLTAVNDSGRRRGAWARLERTFEGPSYLNIDGADGIGLWIKGDGSGAILDIQLQNPREHSSARSDHIVKIDFKGWKYVELPFRERDVDAYLKYEWPFKVGHPEYMNLLRTKFVSVVRVFLDEIPLSGVEGVLDGNSENPGSRPPSLDVAISDIKALALHETTCEDISLKINGEKVPVPFEFTTGDWAELKNGVWNHYDEKGDLKGRVSGPRVVMKAGENQCSYSAKASDRAAARSEVSFFVRGERRRALKPLTDEMKKSLAWEAEMPAVWSPSKGADSLPPVKVRPGEDARLEVTLRGPVKDPVLKIKRFFGWREWKLESVEAGQVRKFTDGPTIDGVRELRLESSDPANADALVEVVKRYVD